MPRESSFVRLFFVILGALAVYFLLTSSLGNQIGINLGTEQLPQVDRPVANIPEEPQVPPIEPEIPAPDDPPEIPDPIVPPPPQVPPPVDVIPEIERPNVFTVSCSLSQFFPSDGDFLIYAIGGEVNLTITMKRLPAPRAQEINVTQNILGIDVWFVVDPDGRTIIESPQDTQAIGTTPFFLLPRHASMGLPVSFGEFQLSIVGEGIELDFNGDQREVWIVEGELDVSDLVAEEIATSVIQLRYDKNSGILLALEEIGGVDVQTEVLLELRESNINFDLSPPAAIESREVVIPIGFSATYSHSSYDFKLELESLISESSVNITESRRFPGADWQLVSWRIVDVGCGIIEDAWSRSLTGGFVQYNDAFGTSYRYWSLTDLDLGSFIRASPLDTDPGRILEIGLLKVTDDQELNIGGELWEVWVAESIEDLGGTILRLYYDKSSGLLVRQESEVDGESAIILELLTLEN